MDSDAAQLVPAPRVAQLDAHSLDDELREFFETSIDSWTLNAPIRVARIVERVRPELSLILNAVLWSSRLLSADGASVGQRIMGISYREARWRRVRTVHAFLNVFLSYVLSRVAASEPTRHVIVEKAAAAWKLLSLMHTIVFLRVGGQSLLVERMLKLRAEHPGAQEPAEPEWSEQTRELLWHCFRDAMLLVRPLFLQARQLYDAATRKGKDEDGGLSSEMSSDPRQCGWCGETATAPVSSSCTHARLCYVCYWADDHRERCQKTLVQDQAPQPITGRLVL